MPIKRADLPRAAAIQDDETENYIEALQALGPQAMTGGQIDGLLASVLCSPTPLDPEAWLPCIWLIDDEDDIPDVDLEAPDTARAVALVFQRLQQLSVEIEDGSYEPLFDMTADGDLVWETWADGFMAGMSCDVDGWTDLVVQRSRAAEAAGLMLTLIDLSRDDAETLKRLGPKQAAHFRKHAPDLLTECVLELTAAEDPSEPIIRGPKIGRNDPCPCGSGAKYKKCCGQGGQAA